MTFCGERALKHLNHNQKSINLFVWKDNKKKWHKIILKSIAKKRKEKTSNKNRRNNEQQHQQQNQMICLQIHCCCVKLKIKWLKVIIWYAPQHAILLSIEFYRKAETQQSTANNKNSICCVFFFFEFVAFALMSRTEMNITPKRICLRQCVFAPCWFLDVILCVFGISVKKATFYTEAAIRFQFHILR